MNKLWITMIFYSLVSYFLGPFLGQKWKSGVNGVQNGILGGILLSLALWFWKGKEYVSSVFTSAAETTASLPEF